MVPTLSSSRLVAEEEESRAEAQVCRRGGRAEGAQGAEEGGQEDHHQRSQTLRRKRPQGPEIRRGQLSGQLGSLSVSWLPPRE